MAGDWWEDGEEKNVVIQKKKEEKTIGKEKSFNSRMKEERLKEHKFKKEKKRNNWKRLMVIRIEKKNLSWCVFHHDE